MNMERLDEFAYATRREQEMPLGDRQENDLVHITLDVWQDKVYYLGKEYPAGYFAAGVFGQLGRRNMTPFV